MIDISKLTEEQKAREYYLCKSNPLYFILNYVTFKGTGLTITYNNNNFHPKLRRVVRVLMTHHKGILMASRQLGKSTISAAMIEWAANFYTGCKCLIVNLNKTAALGNLETIKFIHHNLPGFLKTPLKSKSEIKTYMTYANDSSVNTFYVSSQTSPDKLARSLSAPILYIDETAFIPHMDKVFSSAQPTLSTASEQAKISKWPYFILFTSTPNGTSGTGKFFYDYFSNAMDSDDLFYKTSNGTEDWIEDIDNVLIEKQNNGFNSFIKMKYHWKEDKRKNNDWYELQKRDLNFNEQKISQEIDIEFIGSTSCIFSVSFLKKLQDNEPNQILPCPYYTSLKLFDQITPNDYYLIGVDNARAITGDFCAIEIFSYKSFVQVGEFFDKLGSITKWEEIIKFIINEIYKRSNGKVIVCIERDAIGQGVIDMLLNDDTFTYSDIIWKDDKRNVHGIVTSVNTRDYIISAANEYITENPQSIKSDALIQQLKIIEQRPSGRIESQRGENDDLFMATGFCAYVRKLTILEYLPKIDLQDSELKTDSVIKSLGSFYNHNVVTVSDNDFFCIDDKIEKEFREKKESAFDFF